MAFYLKYLSHQVNSINILKLKIKRKVSREMKWKMKKYIVKHDDGIFTRKKLW